MPSGLRKSIFDGPLKLQHPISNLSRVGHSVSGREADLGGNADANAGAEFQKFLDHRSIVVNCPLGALLHLVLARACALQGDTAKFRAAYQDFFTLWKAADPNIRILLAARSQFAILHPADFDGGDTPCL
jgi:hypothetical protein